MKSNPDEVPDIINLTPQQVRDEAVRDALISLMIELTSDQLKIFDRMFAESVYKIKSSELDLAFDLVRRTVKKNRAGR